MSTNAWKFWKEFGSVTGGSAAGAGTATGAVLAAGTGSGGVVMTTGLATIGGLLGGGMLTGVGVLAVGGGLVFYGTYKGLNYLMTKQGKEVN